MEVLSKLFFKRKLIVTLTESLLRVITSIHNTLNKGSGGYKKE